MLESQKSRLAHASRVGFSASLLTGCLSVALIYCLHTSPVIRSRARRQSQT